MDLSPRDTRGADPAPPADRIADATRRLARLSESDADRGAGGDVVERIHAAVAAQVAVLPRRSRVVASARPGVMIAELALSKAIIAASSGDAGDEGAAIADVDLAVDGDRLARVTVHLIAVDSYRRVRSLLDSGERLRAVTAGVVRALLAEGDARVDLIWEDWLTPDSG